MKKSKQVFTTSAHGVRIAAIVAIVTIESFKQYVKTERGGWVYLRSRR